MMLTMLTRVPSMYRDAQHILGVIIFPSLGMPAVTGII